MVWLGSASVGSSPGCWAAPAQCSSPAQVPAPGNACAALGDQAQGLLFPAITWEARQESPTTFCVLFSAVALVDTFYFPLNVSRCSNADFLPFCWCIFMLPTEIQGWARPR